MRSIFTHRGEARKAELFSLVKIAKSAMERSNSRTISSSFPAFILRVCEFIENLAAEEHSI